MRYRFKKTYIFLIFMLLLNVENVNAIGIPKESDWVYQGIVINPGPSGSWDLRLDGAFSPSSIIKKDGTYFLYYIGSDGDRSTDGGPRHRALGVATSTDGINFEKYGGNPIITYLPNNNEEEGIFSAATALDENGNIILYYGAMNAGSSTSEVVVSDIKMAFSSNGFDFTDNGTVISHSGSSVWGSGDELFPISAFEHNDVWYLYYIAKGGGAYWDLGIAWGPDKDSLTNTKAVLTSGNYILGSDLTFTDTTTLSFFVARGFTPRTLEVRTTDDTDFATLSNPIETYSDIINPVVFFDKDINKLFMYYEGLDKSKIRLKTYTENNTPPTIPTNLQATPVSESQIDLFWTASSDAESTIAYYNLYRDSVKVGTSIGTSLSDTGLIKGTTYIYEVSAVDESGSESSKSSSVSATTLQDTTLPSVEDVTATGTNEIKVFFLEPVEEASSTDILNYAIDNGISIYSATLGTDLKTVTLSTTNHVENTDYTITISNVKDRTSTPNTMATASFTYRYIKELMISNLVTSSGKNYNTDMLDNGKLQYIDRNFVFNNILSRYANNKYIKTANNDKTSTNNAFLEFDVNSDVTVYLAHDDRISTKPSWLSSFVDTGDDIVGEGGTFSIYSNNFAAGHIILGGNGGSSSDSMYNVILKPIDGVFDKCDVNTDGIVDISDLVIVAQHFGETTTDPYPYYDINDDGIVDISDIVQVAVNI